MMGSDWRPLTDGYWTGEPNANELGFRALRRRVRSMTHRIAEEEKMDDSCSFCGREAAQSHTENCPARDGEGEYVEPSLERFNENVQAISDSIDRRDTTIAELVDALDDMLTASQPQHTLKHVFLEEAQEKARIALAKARGEQVSA